MRNVTISYNVSSCILNVLLKARILTIVIYDCSRSSLQGMSYNFEIFHMREKQIPVDSVEIKEPIHAFAWEPVGSKFAIIHGDVPVNVSFYEVRYGHQPALLSK